MQSTTAHSAFYGSFLAPSQTHALVAVMHVHHEPLPLSLSVARRDDDILCAESVEPRRGGVRIRVAFVSDVPERKPARRKAIRRGRRRAGAERKALSEQRQQEEEEEEGLWFCGLMKQLEGQCKNETSIQVSQRPLQSVHQHNAGKINDKSTMAARGHWMPEMLIGPLPTCAEAERFKRTWMQKSRGIVSKRDYGITQAREWRAQYPDLRCYDKRRMPVQYNKFLDMANMPQLKVSEYALATMTRKLAECLHLNDAPGKQ